MYEIIKHFFRSTPDGWAMKLLGIPHIIIMSFVIVSAIALWKSAHKLRKNDILRKPLAVTLATLVTILYSWYLLSGYNGIKEGLPLYSCRIAMFAAITALLTKNRIAQSIACYWGITGGVIAFLLPNLDPFSWPHYTNISFIFGHYLLVLTLIYIVRVDGYRVDFSTAKTMIKLTTALNIFNVLLNALIGSNYNFLRKFPFGEIPFIKNGSILYIITAVVAYNIIIIIMHYLLKMLTAQASHEENEEYSEI